jgi:hypothetical protein
LGIASQAHHVEVNVLLAVNESLVHWFVYQKKYWGSAHIHATPNSRNTIETPLQNLPAHASTL